MQYSLSTVPPSSVSVITQNELINGTLANIICRSDHSKPAALLTWILGGTPLNSQPQTNTSEEDRGYYDSESLLEFTPSWSNHNDVLSCTAKVPADVTGITDSVSLDIKGRLCIGNSYLNNLNTTKKGAEVSFWTKFEIDSISLFLNRDVVCVRCVLTFFFFFFFFFFF